MRPFLLGLTNVDSSVVNQISFCSGIGGLDLGVQLALKHLGLRSRVLAYVEREAYCQAVLLERMENKVMEPAPIWNDSSTFPGERFCGLVDLLFGGYPCGPFSVAGLQKGVDDERHLFPHIQQFIKTARPFLCFFENVRGHLRLGYPEVYRILRLLGYKVECGIYSSEETGFPQKRERLFILAKLANANNGFSLNSEKEILPSRSPIINGCGELVYPDEQGLGKRRGASEQVLNQRCEEVADPLSLCGLDGKMREAGQRQNLKNKRANLDGDGVGVSRSRASLPNSCGQGLSNSKHERIPGAEECGQHQGAAVAEFHRALIPPGPQDSETWEKIIKADPSLEPAICRVVDGPPDWLVECFSNREDRLRGVGNAVSPITAAVAFIELLKKIEKGEQ